MKVLGVLCFSDKILLADNYRKVEISSRNLIQRVETEKPRKYDPFANVLGLIYKCIVEIIPYVITLDAIMTNTIICILKD
ncbi:hypothetical protein CWI38_0217p0020 [Hamiltosporidium tvaerminnensis]|uniref:Uncharacterized protein n=1 Tax=Hamiltosporidium tvaerminnensis TaxID=1176355 RepID=A0A4Q9LZF9_9MICR|nr:hypothetical protein CWI38_0217p0020 [Hamiltosporidium tvaerminnensis]